MRSASDDVEIFYLDDMEDEIIITKTHLKRQNLTLDIQFYLDERDLLEALGRRRRTQAPPPGLIVTDLNMPGRGGVALVKSLRADAAYGRVVIGICTSSENPADHRAAIDGGADFVAPKPFDGATLAHICETTGQFQLIERTGGQSHLCPAAAPSKAV